MQRKHAVLPGIIVITRPSVPTHARISPRQRPLHCDIVDQISRRGVVGSVEDQIDVFNEGFDVSRIDVDDVRIDLDR